MVVPAALGQPGRVGGRFRAAAHAQLGQEVGDVVLHRLLCEVHALADLAVGQSLGDEVEDAPLLVGEAGQLLVLRSGAQPIEDTARHRGIEERLAPADPADAVHQVRTPDLLEDVAGRAGHDRAEQRLVIRERREHEALDLGVGGPDLPAHLDAVAVGETHVEHGHVGLRRRDAAVRLLGRTGLAHDGEVVLGLEQLPQPAPHHLVVVEEEHPHRHAAILALS